MSCADALPDPPPSRRGWPWEVEPAPAGLAAPAGGWPSITVVTPSRNQAGFVEQALRSVLLQGYPRLDYVVLDAGSSDGSAAILERYGAHLASWRSEPDGGQARALEAGFAASSADVLAWLNADDVYLPGALHRVAQAFGDPSGPELVAGPVVHHDEASGRQQRVEQSALVAADVVRYWEGRGGFQQPGLFFSRRLYDRVGGIDATLDFAMDYDLACRMLLAGARVGPVSEPVARFRLHPGSKTVSRERELVLETAAVSRRYWDRIAGVDETRARRFLVRALLGACRRDLARGRAWRAAGDLAAAVSVDARLAAAEIGAGLRGTPTRRGTS